VLKAIFLILQLFGVLKSFVILNNKNVLLFFLFYKNKPIFNKIKVIRKSQKLILSIQVLRILSNHMKKFNIIFKKNDKFLTIKQLLKNNITAQPVAVIL
jgi:histone deacetylase complex regulatory component SIN3